MGAEEEVVEVSDTGFRRGESDAADRQKGVGAKKRSAQKFKGLGSLLKKIESK